MIGDWSTALSTDPYWSTVIGAKYLTMYTSLMGLCTIAATAISMKMTKQSEEHAQVLFYVY